MQRGSTSNFSSWVRMGPHGVLGAGTGTAPAHPMSVADSCGEPASRLATATEGINCRSTRVDFGPPLSRRALLKGVEISQRCLVLTGLWDAPPVNRLRSGTSSARTAPGSASTKRAGGVRESAVNGVITALGSRRGGAARFGLPSVPTPLVGGEGKSEEACALGRVSVRRL